MIKRVSIYCASSTQIDQTHLRAAFETGHIMAHHQIITVYGGGSVGAMGALAKGVLENNGTIVGVIPKFMMDLEWGNPDVSEMIVVDSMAERKNVLLEASDAVIVMPGGTGTLEEFSDVLSLKKLGRYTKPILLLNTNGFFNHLIAFINHMIDEKFLHPEHSKMFVTCNHPSEILQSIVSAPVWDEQATQFAAL